MNYEKTISVPHKDAVEFSLLLTNHVTERPDDSIKMEEYSVDFGVGLRASITLFLLDHFYVSRVLMQVDDNGKEKAVLELPPSFQLLGEHTFKYGGQVYVARIVDEQDVVYSAHDSFDGTTPYTKEMIERHIEDWTKHDMRSFPDFAAFSEEQTEALKQLLYSMVVTLGSAGLVHPSTVLDELDMDDVDSLLDRLEKSGHIPERASRNQVIIEVCGGYAKVLEKPANIQIEFVPAAG